MSKFRWFNNARYGMFVHWGPYSVAARGEWVRNRERIPQDEYAIKYAANFRAEKFQPHDWARLAKTSGMGYVVLTTRHHDGFCLWDTKTTDFSSTRIGPRRDLLPPYVEALREQGLRVGFYYSFADWSHPDYPDPYARDWPTSWPDQDKRVRFVRFCQAQLEELLSEYGRIDVLWYDGCFPEPALGEQTNKRVYELQPDILINERNGAPYDFRCAEQTLNPREGPWEACLTLNDNWGFHAGDDNWKPPRRVIHSLISCARNGGNLLLNVGPRADGTIPQESSDILVKAGDWLRRNRDFLANSDRCPFSWNNWGLVTSRDRFVYLHIFNRVGDELCFAEMANVVESARLLETGEPIAFEQCSDRLLIRGLSGKLNDPISTTIVLEVQGPPSPRRKQETFWIPE